MTNNRSLGKLSSVDPREIWRDEARDFTPWLAENLNLLGEELGLDLELEGMESEVGDFSVDITARESGRNASVIIENQIAATDHSHLGQLLTYAAGRDADVIIWLTTEFREEHKQAVDWLNQRTDDSLEFYGVTINVKRIGDSLPAAVFQPMVVPDDWQPPSKDQNIKAPWVPPRDRRYRPFFKGLGRELSEKHGFKERQGRHRFNHYNLETGFRSIWYNLAFLNDSVMRVRFSIHRDREFNNRLYGLLLERRNQIEDDIGTELKWHDEHPTERTIDCHTNGSIEQKDAAGAWMIETLIKFREVLTPHLEDLIRRLERPDV